VGFWSAGFNCKKGRGLRALFFEPTIEADDLTLILEREGPCQPKVRARSAVEMAARQGSSGSRGQAAASRIAETAPSSGTAAYAKQQG